MNRKKKRVEEEQVKEDVESTYIVHTLKLILFVVERITYVYVYWKSQTKTCFLQYMCLRQVHTRNKEKATKRIVQNDML